MLPFDAMKFCDAAADWRQVAVFAAPGGFGANDAWSDFELRQVYEPVDLTDANGSMMRLRFYGASTEGLVITKARFGAQGGSNSWEFGSAPTVVTFNGGSAGGTVPQNGELLSDPFAFAYTGTARLIAATYTAAGNGSADTYKTGAIGSSAGASYFRSGDHIDDVGAWAQSFLSSNVGIVPEVFY